MVKRAIPSVAGDFTEVLTFLKARGIIPATPPGNMIEHAKKIHRATYSLILWRFRLKGLPPHGKVFIEEIASDALQVLPQALMGYSKTTKLLARGIIENVLRHVYFSDHPVEFGKMNRPHKWYMSWSSLIEYASDHPIFIKSERGFDALNRIGILYGDLSAGVHGRRVEDLEMRIALNKIAYDDATIKRDLVLIEKCTEAANFILAMFHYEKMSDFQVEDRRTILRTMSPRARQVWNNV
jgi:hypothetical protein